MTANYSEIDGSRPLVYLDQNVIDRIGKGHAESLIKAFSSKFRAVYSDTTLDEIIRAEEGKKDSAKRFLNTLKQLEAYYVVPAFSEDLSPLDYLLVKSIDPLDAYESYRNNRLSNGLMEAMSLIPRKLVGGRTEQSLENVGEELKGNFRTLEESINKSIAEFEAIEPNARELLYGFYENGSDLSNLKTEDFNASVEEMLIALKPQLAIDHPHESVMQKFRRELQLTPVQLNNLESPNIVQKIWDMLHQDQRINKSGITIDEYFGLDGRYSLYSDRKPFKSELAITVYNYLNYCGYYPDKKLHKDSNFTSSFSDMIHVSRASYCDAIISGDERLIKKAAATYEYLGIATQVIHVTYDV